MSEFSLHPQLGADTVQLGRFGLSLLLLMNDARYPWCILVPQRAGLREVHEMAPADRLALWEESAVLSDWMLREFPGDKLNLAALGNVVAQLHVHHVVRRVGDEAWPAPVWGRGVARAYAHDERQRLLERVRQAPPQGLQITC